MISLFLRLYYMSQAHNTNWHSMQIDMLCVFVSVCVCSQSNTKQTNKQKPGVPAEAHSITENDQTVNTCCSFMLINAFAWFKSTALCVF